jgi:hypothetical protein
MLEGYREKLVAVTFAVLISGFELREMENLKADFHSKRQFYQCIRTV